MRFTIERVCSIWIYVLVPLFNLHRFIGAKEPLKSPSHYIVTLNPHKSTSLEHFQDHLAELEIVCEIVQDYTKLVPEILYGVAVIVENPVHLAKLERSTHVEKVSHVHRLSAVRSSQRPVGPSSLNLTSQPFPPHVQAGLQKLHELGHFGEGIKVAILDGVADCSLPALGGGFGPGFRIFGRDLVGDAYDAVTKPVPDDNPCGTCSEHGSHVMGTLGGLGVGVAPRVSMGLYRILGCGDDPAVNDDIVLGGILSAASDGADIISLSLGLVGGWGKGSLVLDTINKLVEEKGITIITATGNDGAEGIFYAASPASAKNAISVGSVEASEIITSQLITSTGVDMSYHTAHSFSNLGGPFPVYLTSNSTNITNDACLPLSSSTPDLANYIVLAQRGECPIPQKVENIKAKNGTKVLIYMNSTYILTVDNQLKGIRAATISQKDGLYIFNQVRKNSTSFTLSFPDAGMRFVPNPAAGLMSNFSSYGPSFDFLSPQPALCGVGGQIISTVPTTNGSYSSLSGTSMAAPQIAGIAALVMEVRAKLGKKEVRGLAMRSRLMSTARPVPTYSRTNELATVVHQGGGLANAFCAAYSNTTVSPSLITLKDTPNFNGTQSFVVTNEGPNTVTYLLTHIPAMTINTFAPNERYARAAPIPVQDTNFATIELSCHRIVLKPGQSHPVTVTVTPPRANTDMLPVFSGYINLESDTPCESHSVPYYGVLGSLYDQKVLDLGPTTDPMFSYNLPHLYLGQVDLTKANYTPEGELLWNQNLRKRTMVVYRTNFGTRSVRIFVIPAVEKGLLNHFRPRRIQNCRAPISPGLSIKMWHFVGYWLCKRAITLKPCTMTQETYPYKSCGGVTLLGEIPKSELHLLGRNSATQIRAAPWNGTISVAKDQSPQPLPNGKYKALIRVLLVNGAPEELDSYESWESPVLVIHD